jgi:GlpG protein
MRQVGQFDQEKLALRFWGYLQQQKIDSSLEEDETSGEWTIWVDDEEKIVDALLKFKQFTENPEDKIFLSTDSVNKLSGVPKKETKSSRFKEFKLSDRWKKNHNGPGTVTLSLIITCVGIFLLSGMGKNTQIVGPLFMSEKMDGQLSEFLSGEIWRLITPIFLHFNLLHILFNIAWLYDLGSQIEGKKGWKFFVTFVVILGFFSNFSQFIVSGPNFGGMSGVVYGLFGYAWIKSRFDPGDGFQIDPTVAMIMFGFFILCFTGIFGGVANWAHAGGLVVGLLWGYGSAYRWNRGKM